MAESNKSPIYRSHKNEIITYCRCHASLIFQNHGHRKKLVSYVLIIQQKIIIILNKYKKRPITWALLSTLTLSVPTRAQLRVHRIMGDEMFAADMLGKVHVAPYTYQVRAHQSTP